MAVNKRFSKSLYKQVYEGYRLAIAAGDLRRGQRVPSTRVLAAELGISRMPVLGAYAQLLAEGYFETPSPKGPLRVAFPAKIHEFYFPQLFLDLPVEPSAERSA